MQIKSGQIYRHYKNHEYEILGIGIHSETLEELVIYKMLYDSENYKKGTMWARPLKMWFEEVEWKGKKVPRFVLVSEK